jgi:hypothetical protein
VSHFRTEDSSASCEMRADGALGEANPELVIRAISPWTQKGVSKFAANGAFGDVVLKQSAEYESSIPPVGLIHFGCPLLALRDGLRSAGKCPKALDRRSPARPKTALLPQGDVHFTLSVESNAIAR